MFKVGAQSYAVMLLQFTLFNMFESQGVDEPL